ncbi:MAG: hypothetical protein ACYDDV_04040 [Methanoregula sp.]
MKNQPVILLILAVTGMLILAGCAQPSMSPSTQLPTPQPTAVKPADTIMTASSPLGTILVDSAGKTLYYFANDVPASGKSACTGQCAVIWPVFSAGSVQVSSPLDPADFATITRADGTMQTTYYGRPLYYYQADVRPGDVNGENVNKIWFAMKPDESVLIAQSPALGMYLTDISGKTLYVFTKDSAGTSACTGSCLAQWPAFSSDPLTAPSTLQPGDFSSLSRVDGIKQTAFKGMPLYYYAGDMKPGDANGQKFNFVWFAANVSGVTVVPTLQTLSPSYGSSY